MSLKDISYQELWWTFCSAERNHLCNFGKGHYEKQFCEIILNLDQWSRSRCCLKIFFIWSSGGPFGQQSETVCAILVEGIMREEFCDFFLGGGDLDQWFRRRCHLRYFLSGALVTLFSAEGNSL